MLVSCMHNLVAMLQYRGVDVADLEPLLYIRPSEVPADVDDEYLQQMKIDLPTVAVYFANDFSTKNTITQEKDTTIVVSFSPVDTLKMKQFPNVQFFAVDELLINITNNKLVPRHEIVKDPQYILKQLMATPSQLPKILVTDPMAKYIGAKPGDIVRIIRNSKQAGEYVVYRIVV